MSKLAAVWALADVAMGLMAIVNLVAICLLGKWAFAALSDFHRQATQGQDPVFVAAGNAALPGVLDGDIWGPQELHSADSGGAELRYEAINRTAWQWRRARPCATAQRGEAHRLRSAPSGFEAGRASPGAVLFGRRIRLL
jgi:hypothetical protein